MGPHQALTPSHPIPRAKYSHSEHIRIALEQPKHTHRYIYIHIINPSSQVAAETHLIPPVILQPRQLQNQPIHIRQHVVIPEHGARPVAAFFADLPRDFVVPREHGAVLAFAGALIVAFHVPAVAEEVLEDAVPVGERVVHGDEMLPRDEAGVVPLVVDGCFDGERIGL